MSPMMGFGGAEMLMLLLFLGGFGLPLGVPPLPENPAMAHVAPAECVFYASWSGMGTADPQSKNQTEQLLAEPEVKEFAQSIERMMRASFDSLAAENPDEKFALAAKFGPEWAKTLVTHSVAVFASKLELDEKQNPKIEGGMLIEAGESSAAIVDSLVQLISSEDMKATPVMMGKVKFFRFKTEDEDLKDLELTIGAAGNYVLVGVGKGSTEGMIDRLKAKQIPAWHANIGKHLPVARRATISYVNVKKVADTFLPLAGPEGERIAASLGLAQVGAIESVSGLDDNGMISRTLVTINGESRGLLSLLDGEELKATSLEGLPSDATAVSAFSMNSEKVYDTIKALVVEIMPEAAEQVNMIDEQAEGMFGLKIKEDVLSALGDTWTMHLSPPDSWMSGVIFSVAVRDEAKLKKVLKMATDGLGDAPPDAPAPRIETVTIGKYEIHSLRAPGMPLRPAWCLTKDRLIVSLFAPALRGHLSSKPEELRLTASHPELAKAFAGDGKLIGVGYHDTAKSFETIYGYASMFVPMLMEFASQDPFGGPPAAGAAAAPWLDWNAFPSGRSIHRHIKPTITNLRRTKLGLESNTWQTFPTPNVTTMGPVAVALALPAVQAARDAASRTQSQNNLKQIMLAMHNHADTYRFLPAPYNTDDDGKSLLSWRVKILPYIEQQALYEEFHHDEPWDSEHNKALIEKMPPIYLSPQSKAEAGKTVYLAVGGKTGVFPPPTKKGAADSWQGIGFASITDGTSNTVAVVEANDESAVIWTKPDDFIPDEDEPLKGLLGLTRGGFQGAMGDGSVRFFSETIDPETLKAIFTRNGGEAVDIP